MKKNIAFIMIVIAISASLLISSSDSADLKGSYFGQKPPGNFPVLFTPGIISTDDNETYYPFMFDGQSFVFDRWQTKNGEADGFYTYHFYKWRFNLLG